MHYNYFRDYDPEIGRYIQSDPIGQLFGPVDPQRLVIASLGLGIPTGFSNVNHLYEYAHSNPISYTDFTGESPGTFVFIVVCGIGIWVAVEYTDRGGRRFKYYKDKKIEMAMDGESCEECDEEIRKPLELVERGIDAGKAGKSTPRGAPKRPKIDIVQKIKKLLGGEDEE